MPLSKEAREIEESMMAWVFPGLTGEALANKIQELTDQAMNILASLDRWPWDDWYQLGVEYDLNLWCSGVGQKYATVYPVVQGEGNEFHTDSCHFYRLFSNSSPEWKAFKRIHKLQP